MSRERLAVLALIALCAALLAAGCVTPTGSGSATPTAATAVVTTPSAASAGEATASAAVPASKQAVLHTTKGDITIALYDDMPVTAGNFEKLVREGFYDNVTFHRVMDRFMIQGGDPTGTGMGGPGYTIKDELPSSRENRNDRGTIAMAHTGDPNTAGSQFFINLEDNNFLDTRRQVSGRMNEAHPVFGRVVEGMDVVDAIGKVPVDANDKPVTPVVITSAVML
jgi:peptidylprolyl isomerase